MATAAIPCCVSHVPVRRDRAGVPHFGVRCRDHEEQHSPACVRGDTRKLLDRRQSASLADLPRPSRRLAVARGPASIRHLPQDAGSSHAPRGVAARCLLGCPSAMNPGAPGLSRHGYYPVPLHHTRSRSVALGTESWRNRLTRDTHPRWGGCLLVGYTPLSGEQDRDDSTSGKLHG